MGVEPGRDQHELRPVRLGERDHEAIECKEVLRIGAPRGERDVDGVPRAGAEPGLGQPAGAGIERVLMEADEEGLGA